MRIERGKVNTCLILCAHTFLFRSSAFGFVLLAFSCAGSSTMKSASGPDGDGGNDAAEAGPSADALAEAQALADAGVDGSSSSCPALTFDLVTVPLGAEVWTVTAADVDGDGGLDLVTFEGDGGHVILGDGHGNFTVHGAWSTMAEIAGVVDLNGDGLADIVGVAAAGGVEVLLAKGGGNFGAEVSSLQGTALPLPNPPLSNGQLLAFGDVDGDGRPDVAMVDGQTSPGVLLALGNGDGTFSTPADVGATNAGAVLIADVDGDGHDDLVVGEGTVNSVVPPAAVQVFLGGGTPSLRLASTATVPQSMAITWVALADVDGDGRADVLAGSGPGGTIDALHVAAGGTLSALALSIPSSSRGVSFVAADVDADGHPDIAYVDGIDVGSMTIFHGAAGAKVDAEFAIGIGHQPTWTASGDFDGDGVADLVGSTRDSHDVVVLLSRPHPHGTATEQGCSVCSGPTGSGINLCETYP